jgi:hypothetical protein
MHKPAEAQPVGFIDGKGDEEVVNDSLGTVDLADSTGTDKAQETKDRRPAYEKDPEKKSQPQNS